VNRNNPKISCLMVSRGKLFPAQFAIEAYRAQTYANRELIVVSAEPDSEVKHWLAALGDPSIHYIEVRPAILGALRNISVYAARGDLLAIWDDDDLYGPRRLELQARAMLKQDVIGHCLSNLLMWWPARKMFAYSHVRAWEPSLMTWRETMPHYPDLSHEEDTHVIVELTKRGKIIMGPAPGAYCYIVHGSNTCSDTHFQGLFDCAELRLTGDAYEKVFDTFPRLPLRAYAAKLAGQPAGGVRQRPARAQARAGSATR
jgi:glycosyltransferase involved in cell wall biosynthesis